MDRPDPLGDVTKALLALRETAWANMFGMGGFGLGGFGPLQRQLDDAAFAARFPEAVQVGARDLATTTGIPFRDALLWVASRRASPLPAPDAATLALERLGADPPKLGQAARLVEVPDRFPRHRPSKHRR